MSSQFVESSGFLTEGLSHLAWAPSKSILFQDFFPSWSLVVYRRIPLFYAVNAHG